MKRKFFVLGAIVLIAVVGLFVFEHVTSAQRPDRDAQRGQGQRGDRPGGDRGARSMMQMLNPVSIVDNSWIDLSFNVGIDDDTLVKARPIYQKTRAEFELKMQEVRSQLEAKMQKALSSDDRRTAFQQLQQEREQAVNALVISGGKAFQDSLKKVLTKEQITKLNELTKERQLAQQQRTNRSRGGEGGQRGGQRGQRPSQ